MSRPATTDYKKKKFLVIKIHKTGNLHQHSKSLTRKIPVVLLCLFYKGTSSEEFDDALSAQCDGDVLQTKLRPVKIEDENENDRNI